MNKISFYIAKEYLHYFAICLFSTVAIFSTFIILSEAKLLDQENGWRLFTAKILSSVPGMFETIIPITVMLGTVLTLVNLRSTSEIVSMMAVGISVRQLIQPVLVVGVIIASFFYFNQSYLANWYGGQQINLISKERTGNRWLFFKERLFFFQNLDRKIGKVERGKIIQFGPNRKIERIQQLKGLTLTGDYWSGKESQAYTFAEGKIIMEHLGETRWQKNAFPTLFKPDLINPKYSSFTQVAEAILLKRKSGVSYQKILFAGYQKIAGILAIFIMILLALPFSLFSDRESNVKTGIVISIVLGFIYWLFEQFFNSLFTTGILPAWIAAFGANILFLFLVLLLIYKKTA